MSLTRYSRTTAALARRTRLPRLSRMFSFLDAPGVDLVWLGSAYTTLAILRYRRARHRPGSAPRLPGRARRAGRVGAVDRAAARRGRDPESGAGGLNSPHERLDETKSPWLAPRAIGPDRRGFGRRTVQEPRTCPPRSSTEDGFCVEVRAKEI